MSEISITSFKEKTAELFEIYQFNFAGRVRATRKLEVLDEVIASLAALIDEARADEKLRNTPSFVESLENAVENLNLYKQEREEIAKLQENPLVVKGAKAKEKADRLQSIYSRHYAGQSRLTRDVLLLEDVIVELESVKAELESYASQGVEEAKLDLESVEESLKLYKSEVGEIRSAQLAAETEVRVSALAELANSQFAIYNAQFAGKARVTRRPELLSRIIKNLEDIRRQMRSIQEKLSVTNPVNTTNINVVSENLELYTSELSQISAQRSRISPAELSDELAQAANDLMREYSEHFAGQARATRDLTRLGNLCDAMWEVSRQMEALLYHEDLVHNVDNLDKVNENWMTYEREYVAVKEAKSAEEPQ